MSHHHDRDNLVHIIKELLKKIFQLRRYRRRILVYFCIPSLKIKGVFMSTVVQKRQFNQVTNADGSTALVIHGHVSPEDDFGDIEGIMPGSMKYVSSNLGAATVAADANDQEKFVITWVGAGAVDINFSATDLDGATQVSGVLSLILEEDLATKLVGTLDDVQPLPSNSGSATASSSAASGSTAPVAGATDSGAAATGSTTNSDAGGSTNAGSTTTGPAESPAPDPNATPASGTTGTTGAGQ